MLKKILKVYGKGLIAYWAFVGAGNYLERFWTCEEIVRESDNPIMDQVRGMSTIDQALLMVKCGRKKAFDDAVGGFRKTFMALRGKDPLGE